MWDYKPYVPIEKRKSDAQKKITALKKKNPNLSPVVIEGNKISKTWWGIAWNNNLENYADYQNRIGRGRSYVRNGFVIDLQINVGHISALVLGSSLSPYRVEVTIAPLSKEKWERIVALCSNKISGMEELASGKFPKELDVLFTSKSDGLFPTPKEMNFSCSCPDWADMCKHVAAALYSVGAQLDDDPTLFFKLRDINVSQLLKKSVDEKMAEMLKNAGRKTARVIEDADLSALFGLPGDNEKKP